MAIAIPLTYEVGLSHTKRRGAYMHIMVQHVRDDANEMYETCLATTNEHGSEYERWILLQDSCTKKKTDQSVN